MTGERDTTGDTTAGPRIAPEAARAELARRLHARWSATELPLDRVAEKLRNALHGQKVKGVSKSALQRYMSATHAPVPDKAVLTALAQIFGVPGGELDEWYALQRQALIAQRQQRYGRPTTPTAVPAPRTAGEPGEPGESAPPDRLGRRWRRLPTAKALLAGGAVAAVLAVASAALAPWERTDPPAETATGATRPAQSAVTGLATPERPDLERGTLGEDSRCSAPFPGPDTITWRVCTRVEAERITFALKLTNQGPGDVRIKTRLQYAQATVFHPCTGAPETRAMLIPAGKTLLTDPAECGTARAKTPMAYQGVGWVLAEHAASGSYKLSPTAHVYPDRTIWQPDLV
ncbi:helix-turn-helix domain-containing protein [Streptomyces hesseae]|uniref:Helix-turn-helix transcriptional regulator n=1 Tax=Streptomyces hesseae TaxID=3075519 RepID=A0ABU2STJ2_9ACTN|nr:helix-turn-helix transcriptional regulator [Streptomyces sp. DSM 40473]MDT0452323.1 helix-turn-helix transcriptional regulator [Streptomyces sp. DSM 40473]